MIKAKICNRILFAPEKLFLVIALLFGLAFLIITPPFQVPDEPAHFFRAIQISDFSLIGKKDKTVSGGYIPKQVVDMTNDLTNRKNYCSQKALFINKINVEKVKKYLHNRDQNKGYTFIDFRNTVIYPPIVYLPQILGVGVARIVGLPMLWALYLGRLFNLLLYVAIVFYAIKICPVYKYGLLLFALMPMSMAQVSSLSADASTFSFSFLLIAYIINLAFDQDTLVRIRHVFFLVAVAILLSLSKYAYIFLVGLFFIIPKNKFSSSAQRIKYFLIIFFFAVMASLIWFLSIKNIYLPFIAEANPPKQIHFIISNPFQYLKIILSAFNFPVLRAFVGKFGWLNVPLPIWFCISYAFILFINALLDSPKKQVSWRQRLVVVVILVVSYCFLCSIVYLSTAKIGEKIIWGVQGRYFIPFAPLLLLLLNNQWRYLTGSKAFYNRYKVYMLPIVSVISLSISIWVIVCQYY